MGLGAKSRFTVWVGSEDVDTGLGMDTAGERAVLAATDMRNGAARGKRTKESDKN